MLSKGMTGADVAALQNQLNRKCDPDPKLKPDSIFGPLTDAATRAFQKQARLATDGIVGPNTRLALEMAPDRPGPKPPGPTRTEIMHPLILFRAQQTPNTCWAASTAMMRNMTEQTVIALTPPDLIGSSGGLKNGSGTDEGVRLGNQFGRAHALRCNPPMSWMMSAFLRMLARGPLMVDMLWKSAEYAQGKGSPGHMVVVAGASSDGDESGAGTSLWVLDPWPPNVGNAAWHNYRKWMTDVMTRTYRVFERA